MTQSENMWKAIDAISKLLGAGIITAAISWYATSAEQHRQAIADDTKNVQAMIEFTSKQKDLDTTLGMQMFQILMTSYFQRSLSDTTDIRIQERMVLLRLMALNFQDVPINLKPLFEELNGQVKNAEDRNKLREIAIDVAGGQAFRLILRNGVNSWPIKLAKGQELSVIHRPYKIKVDDIGNDYVNVYLTLESKKIVPFEVTYFAIPLVDNTKIGDERISVTLLSSNG